MGAGRRWARAPVPGPDRRLTAAIYMERMMQTKRIGLVLLLACCAFRISAQTLDTGILGNVSDPAGATIAGAKVTISSPTTGVSRTVSTAADGKYEVRYLVPGEY